MSKTGFKYLGINITRTSLYDDNFTPLINKLKLDFQRCVILQFTLAGNVNCIKNNVLSRFLYLFQCLPLFLLQWISLYFYSRGGGNPRIRKAFLQRDRTHGGLTLPNLMYYYWAVTIQNIIYWLHTP